MPGMRSWRIPKCLWSNRVQILSCQFHSKGEECNQVPEVQYGEGTDNLTGSISCTTCEAGNMDFWKAGVINARQVDFGSRATKSAHGLLS